MICAQRACKTCWDPAFAACLAIALEPTCWRGLGTVSRLRDHSDKKLQDFIALSHVLRPFFEKLASVPERPGSIGFLLPSMTRVMMRLMGTNTSFGSIFLLYYNVAAAYKTPARKGLREVCIKALSLLLMDDPRWYYTALSVSSPSFTRKTRTTMYPDITDPPDIERFFRARGAKQNTLLRLNMLDPVSREAIEAFVMTSREAEKMLDSMGCRLPDSKLIDELHSLFASKRIDYLVYRRKGLKRAMDLMKKHSRPIGEEESMGSIADLTVLTLYYYLLQCSAVWAGKMLTLKLW